MNFLIVTILVAVFASNGVLSQSQSVRLYDQVNGQGTSVLLPLIYSQDLSEYDFENKARSAQITGVYIFYSEKNFNPDGNGYVEYVYGTDRLYNFRTIGGAISSVRYSGHPSEIVDDSITLYEHDYFQGQEEHTFTDLPELLTLSGNHKSLIITGSGSWTFHDQPNFQGNFFCVSGSSTGNGEPVYMVDIKDEEQGLGLDYGTIASIRKGCNGVNTS